MKLTKKIEGEIQAFLNSYWDSYLKGDLDKWATFIPDDYKNIGTTQEELWHSKKEVLDYTHAVKEQMVGMAEMRNKKFEFISYDPYVMVHELGDVYIKTPEGWSYYAPLRLSSLIQKVEGNWQVLHQHGSYPDAKTTEGETFGFDALKAENLRLQEAVKKRTAELETKNRELEIEASLERVRSIAMGMKKPEELLKICEVVYNELKGLGFDEIRNAIIHTFHDEQQYFDDYDYSDLRGSAISRIPYHGSAVIDQFLADIRKGEEAFSEIKVAGKQLADWKKFRKANNEADDPRLDKLKALYYYIYSVGGGSIGISTFNSIGEDKLDILKRFRNVFDLAYKRYADISQAEAQAREAQIEAALERIRATTMAMHRSDELLQTSQMLFDQFRQLGQHADQLTIGIMNESDGIVEIYATLHGQPLPTVFRHPVTEPYVMSKVFKAWKDGNKNMTLEMTAKELAAYNKFRNQLVGTKMFATHVKPDEKRIIYASYFSRGMVAFGDKEQPAAETRNILDRFAKVFDQTYTRFLDLQKAEAQAREAQIEAALEKVRSRSLAMHHTNELGEVITVVFDKLKELNFPVDDGVALITFKDDTKDLDEWMMIPGADDLKFHLPYFEHPVLSNLWNAKDSGQEFLTWTYTQEENESFCRHIFTHSDFKKIPEEVKQLSLAAKYYSNSLAFQKNTAIFINHYTGRVLQEGEIEILKRFSRVFEQAYVRFLDLQKAEAQAREAEIELALERVRARAMAMQHSEELKKLIATVYTELTKLNLALDRCVIWIMNDDDLSTKLWMAGLEGIPVSFNVPYHEHPPYLAFIDAWKKRIAKWHYKLGGKEKKEWDDYVFTHTDMKHFPDAMKKKMQSTREVVMTASFYNFGCLQAAGPMPLTEEQHEVLNRFARVFDSTYTRFNDLKKAEAQAREAQIEAALERVRSKSLAMHDSKELLGVIDIISDQILNLGLAFDSISFGTNNHEGAFRFWLDSPGQPHPILMDIPPIDNPAPMRVVEKQKKGIEFFSDVLSQEENIEWIKHLIKHSDFKNFPKKIQDYMLRQEGFWRSAFLLQNISLYVTNYRGKAFSNEENAIFKRFAYVFEQAYTRFLDLQKAETQAKEAQIEAALERVRSKAMAMHNSQDLADTIGVFYNELHSFSLTPIRCGVGLLDGAERVGELFTWNTTDQGNSLQLIGKLKMEGHPVLNKVYDSWLTQTEYHPVLRGNEIKEYYQVLRPQMAFPEYEHDEVQYGYFFFFKEGGVYAWTHHEMKEDELQIYRRFTSVLSLTYKRYKDLKQSESHALQAEKDLIEIKAARQKAEKALTELQATQAQLIQSEKMASLGELTAGIAHEIQNPLNFVNNFSEVSNELIEELRIKSEALKVDDEEVYDILNDIKQNLEKINFHGKRADSIVKGMLQHSRSSTGKKEPTDINTLADEYLRLAYHGLRAKDKSFNAQLNTNFDPELQKINIVPQDIGRVMLNLINNAFYACTERSRNAVDENKLAGTKANGKYEPAVTISTRKNHHMVEVSVADNGNGIPKKVLDKIFQPFFTTKPTGQGTGLGLSLAYDIIKSHGGELKVQTNEGEGSTFIIALPENNTG